MPDRLQDKVAIITGAGSRAEGIGNRRAAAIINISSIAALRPRANPPTPPRQHLRHTRANPPTPPRQRLRHTRAK